MTPSEWPLRFIPRRSPPIWLAVLITLTTFTGALLARGLLLGFDNLTGLSPTDFPAFIVATLYAGPRWGWASLAAAMLTGYFGTTAIVPGVSRDGMLLQFVLSSAATVLVAAALRETLLRLDEAKAAEAKVQVDLTRTQADLKRINDLLAERVDAALSERDQAEAALRRAQKMEAVGQLTGGVAHDFNNLLTVIIGALDLIQRHPDDTARRVRMIEAAQGAARRGERLTQQLLAFSRRRPLKPELVRVDAILAESQPLLRRAVGEAVTLTVAPDAPGGVSRIDPSQFEAAVMNLVVNARDATPPGGGIYVETCLCTLKAGEAEDAPPGEYLCVSVHDTGAGMDAATVARVFEPFFTTKEPGRGTGLGLSQVYGFARQSGGAAVIESAPGKGATVRIYLPLDHAAAETAQAAPAPTAAPQGPARRVLLVEDDESVGEMVTAMLTDLGHEVLRAEAAARALSILMRQERIDLMLTDLIMPGGMNGVELARQAVALRPGLPVILTSGYTGETLGAAVDAPWPLLTKPYPAETLAAVIEAVMRKAPEAA
ncbi:ATP-binding protein [Phenylobacterium sp.]|uniref:ATP-binding protein n=1 Tax=Phenylobacterium sp. TaxID=1871053 RepID=UPI002E320358|nr:ATP-binding protein [Phenylobacterium sp.]HEX4712819.1 ATP-binding protein [Phenylobacterium sp.]